MNIRAILEEREDQILSPHACRSFQSLGRVHPESPCLVRTSFQHDRDRILHSKSFRRLKHKTQVFLAPEGDHYRTRLTHTLEVAQIARTVARALSLNEDLSEAIALGHDLGHTPFGHAGERVLNELVPGGFHHDRQSLRVVEVLEKEGRGLNLTAEVRDGIGKHSKGKGPLVPDDPSRLSVTLEGRIVRVADIIAYVNHDLDDALRGGVIEYSSVPARLVERLGNRHSRRIDAMVRDLIGESLAAGGSEVRFSESMGEAVIELRDWLFDNVYRSSSVHADFEKASRVLKELFAYFAANPCALEDHGGRRLPGDGIEVSVADFIAGMTDRFALNLYQELFLPHPWRTL